MKEARIQFTAAMIDRILADQKTETRRIALPGDLDPSRPATRFGPKSGGTLLWVAETHGLTGDPDNPVVYRRDHGNEWERYPVHTPATTAERQAARDLWCRAGCRWRPPRFMTRAAARLFLVTEGIDIEPLQAITPEAVRREGGPDLSAYQAGADEEPHRLWFRQTWDAIHTVPADQWDANPTVLVIRFRLAPNPHPAEQ